MRRTLVQVRNGVMVLSALLASAAQAQTLRPSSAPLATTTTTPTTTSPSTGTATSPPNQLVVSKDIVKDFRAICDGKTDAAPAFAAFNKWAVTQTAMVQLTIPSGSVCAFTSNAGKYWAKGIKNLLVIGYGATITNNGSTSPGFFLGGSGQIQDNRHSARVATAQAGTSTVKLLSSAQAALFTVGNYALITGFDLQGIWRGPYGYPSNPHWFEYVRVASIDAASGTITFASPLKNTYKATWPNYNSGSQYEVDNGGPATLYALDPSWDTQVEYRGLTISQDNLQTYAVGRSVTYRDVKFTGIHCGIPTQNMLWQAINTDMSSCTMEVDKLITSMNLDRVAIRKMSFQSSSTDVATISDSTITLGLYGTPKKAIMSNSRLADFRPGAYAYGRSDEVICTNCNFTAFNPAGVLENGFGANSVDKSYSMSNGVISFPNGASIRGATDNGNGKIRLSVDSTLGLATNDRLNISGVVGTYEANGANKLIAVVDSTHLDLPEVAFSRPYVSGGYVGLNAPRWAVPGTTVLWRGRWGTGPSFKVLDVTQDQRFTYVKTNLSGGFPTIGGSGSLTMRVHPAPKFTCTNCTGSAAALDLSQAPAGIPLYSYSKRTYSAASGTTPNPVFDLWGTLKSAKFNVTSSHTGVTPLQFRIAQFNNWPVVNNSSVFMFGPAINMAKSGERVLSGNNISGLQSGDIISAAANPMLFVGPSHNGAVFTASTGSDAKIIVELTTDQGISQ